MKNSFIFILGLAILFVISSCSKEDPKVTVNFNFKVGSESLNFNDNFNLGSTNALANVDIAQFYISNISLIRTDGSEESLSDSYIVSTDDSSIDFGSIEAGSYSSIEFSVGVDSSKNHIDPATYDLSNDLSPQTPSMSWNWNSGYKFLRIDGQVDTDGDDLISESDSLFLLHIGLDDYLKTVSLPLNYEAEEDAEDNLNITVDMGALLNYDIMESREVRTGMVNAKHDGIVNNLPSIFSAN